MSNTVIIQLIDTIVKIYRKLTMYPALFQSIICNPHQTQWNRHDLSPFSRKRNWGPTISKWQCRNIKCKPSASRVLSLTTGLFWSRVIHIKRIFNSFRNNVQLFVGIFSFGFSIRWCGATHYTSVISFRTKNTE